jgi:transposase
MKKVTQNGKKVELYGKRCYVGVDVHKKTYYAAILSEDGLSVQFSCPAQPETLVSKIQGMGIEIISLAQESGPTGYELAWYCQKVGVPIIVAAATKIPRQITPDSKTDRLDGLKLAEYLSRKMLYSVTIPTREEFTLRELERRRQQLVRSRRELRQQIKSFMLKNGIESSKGMDNWTDKGLKELMETDLGNPYLRLTVDSFLREHKFICEEIKQTQNALTQELSMAGKDTLLKNLRSIPGVGIIVSQTYVTEIFRPERFDRAEEICAYVGLAPITSKSGQGKGTARLTHVGQRYLRSILIESAWRLVWKEEHYRTFFNKIVGRTNIPQKAIVAVARKLLIIIWRVSVENRVYQFRG